MMLQVAPFWPAPQGRHLTIVLASRNPMFVSEFDGALLTLNVKRPSREPLFQLPPRIRSKHHPLSKTPAPAAEKPPDLADLFCGLLIAL